MRNDFAQSSGIRCALFHDMIKCTDINIILKTSLWCVLFAKYIKYINYIVEIIIKNICEMIMQ
jgi:hypothetical protein